MVFAIWANFVGSMDFARGLDLRVTIDSPFLRKILVSVKFVSAILGPEMGAPILWTPGKNAFFLQEKLCP